MYLDANLQRLYFTNDLCLILMKKKILLNRNIFDKIIEIRVSSTILTSNFLLCFTGRKAETEKCNNNPVICKRIQRQKTSSKYLFIYLERCETIC